jgi:hypothetical protein
MVFRVKQRAGSPLTSNVEFLESVYGVGML